MTALTTLFNLFNPRTVLFAKHAQHVVFVHFPIALTMTAIAFEWLALWRPGSLGAALVDAAYWNLTGAAATVVAAVATGIGAWRWELEGTPLTGTLLLHAAFGAASAIGILVLWSLRLRRRRGIAGAPGLVYFGLTVLVFAVIAATGHLGGFVSGVNAIDP